MINDVDPATMIGRKIGDYTLLQFLGRGSFATVYRATSQKDNGQYAVKMIPRNLIEYYDCGAAFETEVNIMLNIDHPNIVHCEQYMPTQNNYYLVMKVANNGDLAQFMFKNGIMHFDEKTAVHFLKQIASGFMELRKNHIIHRDFK